MVLILGLGGVTCSGKTSLTDLLEKRYRAKSVHMDEYFHPEGDPRHELVPQLGHLNWELPSSLDLDKMYKDAKQLISTAEVSNLELIILEGFLVLNDPRLSALCQIRVYMDLPYEQCRDRRAARIYIPADVPGYFEQVAWPAGVEYKRELFNSPSSASVVVLDGLLPLEVNLDKVSSLIATHSVQKS